MAEPTNLQERKQGTGTWYPPGPVNFFSFATYRDEQGRIFQLPVRVAGDDITGQAPQVPPTQE